MKLRCNYRIWQIELTVEQAELLIRPPTMLHRAWWETNFTVVRNNLCEYGFDEVELIYDKGETEYPPVLIFRTGPAKTKRSILRIVQDCLGMILELEAK